MTLTDESFSRDHNYFRVEFLQAVILLLALVLQIISRLIIVLSVQLLIVKTETLSSPHTTNLVTILIKGNSTLITVVESTLPFKFRQ